MRPLPHLTSSDAARILKRVRPEYSFRLHSGSDIDNLQGLAESLKLMSDPTFKYHVTKDRNDFANWVMDVLGDDELAEEIRKAGSREEIRRRIASRIAFLRQINSEQGVSAFFMRHAILEFSLGIIVGLLIGILVAKLL